MNRKTINSINGLLEQRRQLEQMLELADDDVCYINNMASLRFTMQPSWSGNSDDYKSKRSFGPFLPHVLKGWAGQQIGVVNQQLAELGYEDNPS